LAENYKKNAISPTTKIAKRTGEFNAMEGGKSPFNIKLNVLIKRPEHTFLLILLARTVWEN
jgi:hypothetical protein